MIKGVTLDLDGTVYLGSEAVEGAADFIAFLRGRGVRILFVTNRANRLPDMIVEQLQGMGIDCTSADLFTSSQATADHLAPGRAYIIGEEGLSEILEAKGFTITDENPDYVIVSYDRSFDYEKLKKASLLIQAGAQFFATNPDQGLTFDGQIIPGTGSILAAVEVGCQKKAQVVGKPNPMILEIAAKRMGLEPSEVLAVGDNVDTDLPSAKKAGMQTAIILTGLSTRADVEMAPEKPDFLVNSFAELTDLVAPLI